ncbi:hypothetical protein TSTA_009080 [Talaromyces stipitatus ATCC 10500]|uniref:Uncharacterized protein n=1 Tax=Talaromyces stipitatus (strain ATCC 10500 / CBS 375.48 / QM 6759 / NRRL 1006) TaxID=441959 RepID=B8MF14_TALSN|nr:uncharacterized protein TSTA_009080 [Talaromyces stipitatus ATCC 10500]EED15783.1 hypothetical protein TSTA_009080 [Talaromyces stipitatus ATCC 10500]
MNKGQFIRTYKPIDPTPASTIYEEMILQFLLHASVHRIVHAVGKELAECLTGVKDGLQIIFGNKENKNTLDDLYENWPLVCSSTIALSEFIKKAIVSAADKNKPGLFYILKIIASTGDTTKYMRLGLVKIMQNMFWLDIAVGLFEGWWLFEDGCDHAVTLEWLCKEHLLCAGFKAIDWTDGLELEMRTIWVIAGFPTNLSA